MSEETLPPTAEERLPQIAARVLPRFGGQSWPPGWDKLVTDLDADLAGIAPDYKIGQVKEKFGGLRYYVEWDSIPVEHRENINRLITVTENTSQSICEECGQPGVTRSVGGWWATECDLHHRATLARRQARGLT